MSSMQLLPYKQQVSSLLRLGLPIVVGQLGMIILGLADTIMIGHHSTDEYFVMLWLLMHRLQYC